MCKTRFGSQGVILDGVGEKLQYLPILQANRFLVETKLPKSKRLCKRLHFTIALPADIRQP